ncbi:MAG TPA: DUF362 domain-containing protein [Acidobacteriaceae bacterium]|jgi:uncharacterized protein (DUF362 family)|nr:DUF362 domain-containing protein [Acidobacteriaceae bacterium]
MSKMLCHESRRKFLKTSFFGGAAAVAATSLPAAWASQAAPAAKSASAAPAARSAGTAKVSLATGNDRADIAFKSLQPFKAEIAAAIGNKRVILKPNNVIINVPLCATNADNLEGILEFLKSIGKTNVILAESPAGGSVMEGFNNYGYPRLAKKYGIKLVDLDAEKVEVVQCIDEKDFQPHPVRVAKIMMDPANNFVISAAKLKTHDLVGITLSLKNVVIGSGHKDAGSGLANAGPGGGRSDKRLMHGGGTHGINYNIFTLSSVLHPHLAVIDGYEGMEGTGPVHGTPISQKVCIASLDWLAADRIGAELMGVDVSKIGYLKFAIDSGNRGQGDLSKIQIVGPPVKNFAKTYQLPNTWQQIISWQRPMLAS